MPKKECLEHPGCIWSCPCDCFNCMNFKTTPPKQLTPKVIYSPVPTSFPREVSKQDNVNQDFPETFYDALLPLPEIETQIEDELLLEQVLGSQTVSPSIQTHSK